MVRGLIISLILLASAHAQILQGVMNVQPSSGATPGFVNETSKNSTLTSQVTTRVATSTTCVDFGYCFQFADAVNSDGTTIVQGNLGVLFFQYNHASTAVTSTATDDAGDNFTCGASVQIAATGTWVNYCYKANLTIGAHGITLVFGTTTVTQVMGKAQVFYHVDQTTPLDDSNLCSGTSSTTAGSCPVTTTAANDLVDVYVARVGTPAVTSVTPGSGYTLGTTDVWDGGHTEFKVIAGTGSTTPTMTMASASTYGMIVLAFKAANLGTVPTGWYAQRMLSWSYLSSSSGNRAFQFPSSGNLLVNANSCNTLAPTGISDVTNTWTAVGPIFAGIGNNNIEFYAPNAAANPTGALTVNAPTVTGDCTYFFYDFIGAPTAPVISRASYNAPPDRTAVYNTSPLPFYPGLDNQPGNVLQIGSFLPTPTNGLTIGIGGQFLNTTTSISTPSSGCYFDAATNGGENLDGPYVLDQNNPFGHCWNSGTAANNYLSWGQTKAAEASGGDSGDVISFYGSSGTGIIHANYFQGSSATFLEGTIPATTTGNLYACQAGVFNATARTVTKVCLAGDTTCSTGTQLTNFAAATSTGTGHAATSSWYVLSAPNAATKLDVIVSNTASNIEVACWEVQKGSGTWATDVANQTTNTTASTFTYSGPAVTTTGAVDFCASNEAPNNTTTFAPKTGNEFLYGGTIFSSSDGAVALLTTTAGSHTPQYTVGTTGDTASGSTACYK